MLNTLQFEPFDEYNFINKPGYSIVNHAIRGIWYDFFQSGQFELLTYTHRNPDAPTSLDWVGVN